MFDAAEETAMLESQEDEREGPDGEDVDNDRVSAPTAQPGGASNSVGDAEDVEEGGDSVGPVRSVSRSSAQISCENNDEADGDEGAVAGADDEAGEIIDTGTRTPSFSRPEGRRRPRLRRSFSRSPNQRPLKMVGREMMANMASGIDGEGSVPMCDRTVLFVSEVKVEVLQAIPSEGESVEKATVVVPREMWTGLEDVRVVSDMKLELTGMEGHGFSVIRKGGCGTFLSVRVHSKKE